MKDANLVGLWLEASKSTIIQLEISESQNIRFT